MKMSRKLQWVINSSRLRVLPAVPLLLALPVFLAFAPATQKGKEPQQLQKAPAGAVMQTALPPGADEQLQDGAGAKTKAIISVEARTLLDQLRDAYSRLEAAELNGHITADLEMGGQKQKMKHQFSSSFQAPNKFRHELEDGLLIGSTGEKTYVYQKSAQAFFQQKAPDGKVAIRDLPSPIPQLLQTQNPSLLFAIIQNPISGVTDNMKQISKIGDVRILDRNYPALALTPQDGQSRITILIDPATHLLKRLDIEITPDMLKGSKTPGGLESVKAEIEYTSIRPQIQFDADHFAWAPPDGAQDMSSGVQKERTAASAQTLVGSPAPDFTLETLDGEPVSLSDLKGQVVVLDFWATWCPPCVRSLPELDRIYQEKSTDEIRIFAVNLKEDAAQVQKFLRSHSLSVPILLDKDGEAARKYNIHAIPQTIVIGKDGEVKKVFVGAGNDTAEQLRAEIESASGDLGE